MLKRETEQRQAIEMLCVDMLVPQDHLLRKIDAAGDFTLFERESLVFHVSGGTTDLLLCHGAERITPLGTSSDLYAGQAVDRLGVKLGFPFPAGVYVSEQAALCKEKVHPKVSVHGLTCSLSGLENQCAKLLAGKARHVSRAMLASRPRESEAKRMGWRFMQACPVRKG